MNFLGHDHLNWKQLISRAQAKMHMECSKLNRQEIIVLINTLYFLSKKTMKLSLCVPEVS